MVFDKAKINETDEKKAYPELMLKQQIAIVDRGKVIEAYKELERNRKMNGGVVNLNDKSMFEAELSGLFLDVRNMICAKKKYSSMNEYEKDCFFKLSELVKGKENLQVSELIKMMNFLFNMLHLLNITNLLMNERDSFDDWKHDF